MKKKVLLPILMVALAVLTAIPALPAQAAPADGGLPTVNWLPPLSNQGEFQLKDGSTLPIKFTLTDPDTGAFVEDTSVRVDVNEVLFRDDFNDGTADGWIPVTGDNSWSVVDGVLRCTPVVTHPRILAGDTMSYSDYVFEADARVVSGRGYALIFRAEDYQSFYSFQYQAGSSALSLRLYQFTNFPTGADVAPLVPYATDNDWHHLKVVVEGINIKCYVDGYKVFDVDDEAAPAPLDGGIGFRTWSSTTAEFDNVMVLSLPAAESFDYGEGSDNVRISYDTVFADNFDDGNYDGWAPAVAGDTSWSVEDGVLRCTPEVSYPRILACATLGYRDYAVEADARFVDGLGYALLFRAADHNNFYSFQYDPGIAEDLRLSQFADFPNYTDVADLVPYTIDSDWHHLKVVVIGDHIRCYIDGNKVFDVTDTVAPVALQGGIGFRMWSGGEAEFDNVTVQVPHYIANLHTKELEMTPGDYLITVWSGSGDQLGTYLFDLTDAIQGTGRGKGKA